MLCLTSSCNQELFEATEKRSSQLQSTNAYKLPIWGIDSGIWDDAAAHAFQFLAPSRAFRLAPRDRYSSARPRLQPDTMDTTRPLA